MKRMLSGILILLAGVMAGLLAGLLLPTETRLKVSRQLAAGIGRMEEQCPEG